MNRQQEIAKAREVDTRIAEQWNLYYDKASEARMVEVRAEQLRKNAARQPRFAATFEEQAARLDRSVKVLRAEAREMFLETCPTVESIRRHLTDDNGWDPVEVDDLLEHRCIFVNEDGTTSASHDLWEYMAQQEPESN